MLFSIMVPVYNVKPYLPQCIESILNQSYTDFELIIVDDGSTDGSSEICDNYAHDKRVKIIHKPNGGHTSARKEGLKHATGEYCCFVDSDDYIDEDYLKTFADAINRFSPDVTMIDCIRFNDKESFVIKNNCEEGLYIEKKMDDLKSRLIYDKTIGGMNLGAVTFSLCNKCFKRRVILEYHQNANKDIKLGEDMMLTMPIIANADSVYVSRYNGYYYRDNPKSIVNTYRASDFENTKKLIALLDSKMKEHYEQLSHYLLFRMCNTVVSAAKYSNSYKQFESTITQLFTIADYERINDLELFNLTFKKKFIYFFITNKMWIFIWMYAKLLK